MKKQILFYIILDLILLLNLFIYDSTKTITSNKEITENTIQKNQKPPILLQEKNITLSFVGDCTIGSDPNFGYHGTFHAVYDQVKDDSYFFKKVENVLKTDDLTIANLETTFTNATIKKEKRFNFKGNPTYVNILKKGSIEAVHIANNHTYDYLTEGLNDTKNTLLSAGIPYYGYQDYLIYEVNHIKVGIAGFNALGTTAQTKTDIITALNYFNSQKVDVKIITLHWGIEKDYRFNDTQQSIGHVAIDHGADLVVGHHPHVLQGIEAYKDAYIVYSLANFVFGGNRSPYDYQSFILQYKITSINNKLYHKKITIIPVFISSKETYNNYQPMLAEGTEKEKIIDTINNYSVNFKYVE